MPTRPPRSPRAQAIAATRPAPSGWAAALGAAILALLAGFALR
jgi:hypothetical protein